MFLQLHDRVGDFLRPIAAAALDHADRKAVQRDIEDVPAAALEPGGHAAELVVLLEQQHAMAGAGQRVGRGQPGQAAADDDHVVLVAGAFEKIFGHASSSKLGVAVGLVGIDRWLIGHRDAADDRADDADEALVGAADEQVLQVRGAVVAACRARRRRRRCRAR